MNKTLLVAAIMHALMTVQADAVQAIDVSLFVPLEGAQKFTIFIREGAVRAPSYRGLRNDLFQFGEPILREDIYAPST